MEDLPDGNKLSESTSVNGTYRLELFLCVQSGTQYIRGALTTIASGETKNIYWDIYSSTLDVEWIDDATVKLGGHSLNVMTDIYDCRESK